MTQGKRTYFRIGATILLLVAMGIEINHSFIRQVPWQGFELAANFASFPLLAAWGLALAGLWSNKAVLKPWLVLGIFFLVMQGIVISTGGNSLAAAYIFSGLGAALFAALGHIDGQRAKPLSRGRPDLRIAS